MWLNRDRALLRRAKSTAEGGKVAAGKGSFEYYLATTDSEQEAITARAMHLAEEA
jgi:hypothetical protein